MSRFDINVEQQTTSGHEDLDKNGLCLLSIDGGGIRGLSSLYILKKLVDDVNDGRSEQAKLKPCEMFDLIAGTSTGGLIAIMLGRLKMTVDECIAHYNGMMEPIFAEKSSSFSRLKATASLKYTGKYDSGKLESAIKAAIKASNGGEGDPDAMFRDTDEVEKVKFRSEPPRGCRVFVVATNSDPRITVRIKSYGRVDPTIPATICKAALATSAATTFFAPVKIGNRTFVDGGLGANNPIDEVEKEATNLWCPRSGRLQPLVKCFISIGTGKLSKNKIEDGLVDVIKTLVTIATDTEDKAQNFAGRWREAYDQHRYFRFNVQHGLQDVGLEKYEEKGRIEASTMEYLEDREHVGRFEACVENLKKKENKTNFDFECTMKLNDCLRDLDANPSRDFEAMKTNDGFIPKLCDWILEHSTFSQWRQGGQSNLLWLFGGPGKGKTRLAMRIISELGSQPSAVVCYFFCDEKHNQKCHATDVLRGFLWQLLWKRRHLFRCIRRDYLEQGKRLFEGSNKFDVIGLWKILEKLLTELGQTPAIFIIDGLDELEMESCKTLLENITSQARSKWLLTSRTEFYIEKFRNRECHSVVDLEHNGKQVKTQVNRFVEIQLERLQKTKGYGDDAKERMKNNICQGSEGSFLWTWLIFKEMDLTSGPNVEEVLRHVPRDLDEYFTTMLSRITKKPQADKRIATSILEAAFLAFQPLGLGDLLVVAGLSQNMNEYLRDQIGLCSSYLEIRDEKICFVHQYAKDHLAKHKYGPDLETSLKTKHSEIAKRCLHFSCEMNRSSIATTSSYPTLFWPAHAKKAADAFSSAKEPYEFFLDKSEVRTNWLRTYWSHEEGSKNAPNNFTILHLAAYLGISPWIRDNPRNLRFLNERDSHKATPLMRAVQKKHCEVADLLLKHGAVTSIISSGGSTLLYQAVYNNDKETVKLLLSETATPLWQRILAFLLGVWIRNMLVEWITNLVPRRLGTRLYWAAYHGKPAEMKHLLREVGANAYDRETPLSQAVAKGNTKIVELLLEHGANPNGDQGEPTLYRAVFRSNVCYLMEEMVYELLKRGAPPTRERPLYRAMWQTSSSSLETVDLLLQHGANPNSHSDESPIYRATLYGNIKMVAELLEKGAPPVTDEFCLYRAVCNRDRATVKLLLESKANPNKGCGNTPLLQALWRQDESLLKLLLDKGAFPQDSSGAPLVRALIGKVDSEIAKMLVKHGADPNADPGPSLLYQAQWGNHIEITKALLEKGAVPYGGSPLYLAVYHEDLELVKLLLEKGANPNCAIGETPLWRAVMHKDPNLVWLDLQYKACPDTPCEETPLLRACYGNNTEIAKLLLSKGADPKVSGGEFPLARATWNGNEEIQRLLVAKNATEFDVNPSERTPLYWAQKHGNEDLFTIVLASLIFRILW